MKNTLTKFFFRNAIETDSMKYFSSIDHKRFENKEKQIILKKIEILKGNFI